MIDRENPPATAGFCVLEVTKSSRKRGDFFICGVYLWRASEAECGNVRRSHSASGFVGERLWRARQIVFLLGIGRVARRGCLRAGFRFAQV
jgi:hypothetical protein